jgi:hypothetical protein
MGGTPTGGRDEGVASFEQLIAKLKGAIDRMQENVETVEGHASALDELEDTVEERVGAVSEALEEELTELGTARDQAVEEIDDVAAAARAAADERLQEAVQSIDAAETRFEGSANAAGTALDDSAGELREEGFSVLGADLDVVEQGLNDDKAATDSAVDAFEAGVQGEGQEFQQALADTGAKVDEASTATAAEQTEIVAKSDEATRTFETEGTEFGQQCTSVYEAVETRYDGVDTAVAADQKTFVEMVRDELKATADAVQSEIASQLEGPVDTLLEVDADLYMAELDVVAAQVAAVQATAARFDPIVTNLETCKEVCDVVQGVIDAVAKGGE